mmetsp:Transcript_23619/g.41872  ORF Transcript_23619/g.41872 Transcript_23619/m.41872 type:complete len:280 (+) Transcript_23619:1351-2190(+)
MMRHGPRARREPCGDVSGGLNRGLGLCHITRPPTPDVGVSRGQEHLIDGMDHAVGRKHIRLNHVCAVHRHPSAQLSNRSIKVQDPALQRHNALLGADHVARCDLTAHDVIGQNIDQLVLVFRQKQAVYRACGKGCKGVVGGRKNGEGAVAFQRINQSSRLQGCHKRRKVRVARCHIDDVIALRSRASAKSGQCGTAADQFQSAASIHAVILCTCFSSTGRTAPLGPLTKHVCWKRKLRTVTCIGGNPPMGSFPLMGRDGFGVALPKTGARPGGGTRLRC